MKIIFNVAKRENLQFVDFFYYTETAETRVYQRTLVLRFMFATKSPCKIANIKVRVAASRVWTNFVVGRSGKNARTRVYNKLRVCEGYWRLSYRYYMVDEPWEFLRKNVTPDSTKYTSHQTRFQTHFTYKSADIADRNTKFYRKRYRRLSMSLLRCWIFLNLWQI